MKTTETLFAVLVLMVMSFGCSQKKADTGAEIGQAGQAIPGPKAPPPPPPAPPEFNMIERAAKERAEQAQREAETAQAAEKAERAAQAAREADRARVRVSAPAVFSAWQGNELAASQKYSGTLRVRGIIRSIEKKGPAVIMNFYSGNDYVPIIAGMDTSDAESNKALASFQPGQSVKVDCDSSEKLATRAVLLKGCTVVNWCPAGFHHDTDQDKPGCSSNEY